MPTNKSGAVSFQEDGAALIDGRAPVPVLLAELCSAIELFVLYVKGCARSAEGEYLIRDPKAGRLCGVEIQWSNIVMYASIAEARILGVAEFGSESNEQLQDVRFAILRHRRADVPLGDALKQIAFLFAQKGATFPDRIRGPELERLSSIAQWLTAADLSRNRVRADETAASTHSPTPLSGSGTGDEMLDGDYRPVSAFPVEVAERLREAAAPRRKSKRVRRCKRDGVYLYSVDDARRWWPAEMSQKT
ncbi:MAG: hypothetical protein ACTS27_12065 [Phycisphaerales bacterium]